MNNKMSEVAKLLGVELGEEFNITDSIHNPYKFTNEGLLDVDGEIARYRLMTILTGENKMIKKPWKPDYCEEFKFITPTGEVVSWCYDSTVTLHRLNYKIGNCFKPTTVIPQETIDKFVKFLNSDERIELC